MDYQNYLNEFEQKLIIPGSKKEEFKIQLNAQVPLKKGKLINTPFGELIKDEFDHKDILTINYYGLFKLSSGIHKLVSINNEYKIKLIRSPIVYFNSIKKEHIKKICPELLKDFDKFKKHIVALRWKATGKN